MIQAQRLYEKTKTFPRVRIIRNRNSRMLGEETLEFFWDFGFVYLFKLLESVLGVGIFNCLLEDSQGVFDD
ncbi:hypothetical protein DAT35_15575 [Vitiosangium sp. GDMCC 1.1324]|nr:hypothetical protein DAT35_15575 [Vitiosangium sp. GDMCC 1.1324]